MEAKRILTKPARSLPAPAEEDLRAILGVCDCLIGCAGRTTLMMALRGSRAKRVLKFNAEKSRGFGHYAGRPESEVIAMIDGLISESMLCIESHGGFPLLGYTARGLELAMRFAAEEWLSVLQLRVQPVSKGSALELPFLMSVMPQRNQNTVFLLVSLAGRVADRAWLPLLRAWRSVETKRVRAKLDPIILRLEQT